MFPSRCINSVFLTHGDDSKGYKPMIISGPRPYNPKVKIHGWQDLSLSQPHDNERKGFKESTYKRLGINDDSIGISVTRAMTEQIRTKALCAEETEEYKKALETSPDLPHPKSVEPVDYRTTLRDDFPWHYPEKALPPRRPYNPPPKPWLMYRRTLGCNSDDVQRRPGIRHFLDDDDADI